MDYKRTFGSGDSTIKLTLYPQRGELNVVGTLISKRFPHEVYLMQWADDRLSAGGRILLRVYRSGGWNMRCDDAGKPNCLPEIG